jgi:hypothetical protein
MPVGHYSIDTTVEAEAHPPIHCVGEGKVMLAAINGDVAAWEGMFLRIARRFVVG